jgi:hypothetical protein
VHGTVHAPPPNYMLGGMKALIRNNIPVALILFGCWFGINFYRVTISGAGALLTLALFFIAFVGTSYLALHDGLRSFLWAIGWMIITVVVSAVIILFTLGLGFTHI